MKKLTILLFSLIILFTNFSCKENYQDLKKLKEDTLHEMDNYYLGIDYKNYSSHEMAKIRNIKTQFQHHVFQSTTKKEINNYLSKMKNKINEVEKQNKAVTELAYKLTTYTNIDDSVDTSKIITKRDELLDLLNQVNVKADSIKNIDAYNDAFFENNSLIVSTISSFYSSTLEIDQIYKIDNQLFIHFYKAIPNVLNFKAYLMNTTVDYFYLVEVSKKDVDGITKINEDIEITCSNFEYNVDKYSKYAYSTYNFPTFK